MRPTLLVLAAFTIFTALLAWSRWLAGRRWAAAGHLVLACATAVAVALAWPIVAYVKTFEPLVPTLPVAELTFEQTGPERFRVTLTRLPSGRMQVVDVAGREWQLQLRALRWADWMTPFGPAPAYRIQSLGARPGATGPSAATEHDLDSPASPEPWLAGIGARRGRPMLESQAVSGAWLPMSDRVRYEVLLSAAGRLEIAPRGAPGE
jgi:hypothetical protein